MICKIFLINLLYQRRYFVGSILNHTDMSKWLREKGDNEHVYEIWKDGAKPHSRWKWKEKKQRWGRMATPSKDLEIMN